MSFKSSQSPITTQISESAPHTLHKIYLLETIPSQVEEALVDLKAGLEALQVYYEQFGIRF